MRLYLLGIDIGIGGAALTLSAVALISTGGKMDGLYAEHAGIGVTTSCASGIPYSRYIYIPIPTNAQDACAS